MTRHPMLIPYLPPVGWYRELLHQRLTGEQDTCPVATGLNHGVIRGAWGEQTLTVPIAGGRRQLARTPYAKLRLSEHDDWRHKHLQAITSAYGSMPYFPYFRHLLEQAYRHPCPVEGTDTLSRLCHSLHHAFMESGNLENLSVWLASHPQSDAGRHRVCDVPDHVTAFELLFMYGPETIFYLL